MKKEIIIAMTGIALLYVAYIFELDKLKESSPLALLVIASIGLLTSARYKLITGSLLTFSGIALAVHPFMFASSLWLLPGALLVSIAGIMILINWWKQNSK